MAVSIKTHAFSFRWADAIMEKAKLSIFFREVERELGLLFSKGGTWRSEIGNKSKQSRSGTNFRMLVEDVREGVLVSIFLLYCLFGYPHI